MIIETKLMREFRITKYDPALRNEQGWFIKDDWTSVSDVGSVFSGMELTLENYTAVERAYTETVRRFLEEAAVDFLQANDLDNRAMATGAPQEGSLIKLESIPAIVGALLREEYWCRLESSDAFVHVGYDYYMYVGVTRPCNNSIRFAHEAGLFVEEFISPYHPENES